MPATTIREEAKAIIVWAFREGTAMQGAKNHATLCHELGRLCRVPIAQMKSQ